MKVTNKNTHTHTQGQRERERVHADKLCEGAPFWRDCAVKVVIGQVTV